MAIVKVLARGWKVEVGNGANPETFIEIKGLKSLGFDNEKTDADTTSFDEDGAKSHIVASRGSKLSLEGNFLEDQTNGSRDPGQQAVEDLAELIGPASLGNFRLTSPGGKMRNFIASANVSGIGGGTDDPTGWKADITVSGKIIKT